MPEDWKQELKRELGYLGRLSRLPEADAEQPAFASLWTNTLAKIRNLLEKNGGSEVFGIMAPEDARRAIGLIDAYVMDGRFEPTKTKRLKMAKEIFDIISSLYPDAAPLEEDIETVEMPAWEPSPVIHEEVGRRVGQYAFYDCGINNPSYFVPPSHLMTDYEWSAQGVGDTPNEAINDLMEMMATMGWDADEFEKRLGVDEGYPHLNWPEQPSAFDEACSEIGIKPEDYDDFEHGEIESNYYVACLWNEKMIGLGGFEWPVVKEGVEDDPPTVIGEDGMSITKGDYMVDFTDDGEGLNGDYDDDDPDDVPLLRIAFWTQDPVYLKERWAHLPEEDAPYSADAWEYIDDSSYCTDIDADAPVEVKKQILQWVMNKVYPLFMEYREQGGPSRRVFEALSWISFRRSDQTMDIMGDPVYDIDYPETTF